MPKRKEPTAEDELPMDILSLLSHKKHKKHKHKKHKRKKGTDAEGDDGSEGASPPGPNESVKPGLKLKIKIGGQTFGEARVSKSEINDVSSNESASVDAGESSAPAEPVLTGSSTPTSQLKKSKKVDEEEAWLAALEAGRLEEVDEELRRMKDPTLMTARQRSLLESKAQKEKEEPAPVVHEEKELTEEMIQRRIIRAKKRKEQAEEKREKDKKQTIERLLKKTDAKIKGAKKLAKKANVPKVTYINSQIKGISLSLPSGVNFPLQAETAKIPPTPTLCGVAGCENIKKYACSKTGIPLCSLECYKKNLLSLDPSQVIPVT